jgi:uncharacterized membrane protein YgcG
MQRRILLMTASALVGVGAAAPLLWAQGDRPGFKPEELDQMLAPVALYPDPLLSQVLMAAGYPLEVVEAARWSKANPALKGDAAVAAVKDKGWDASVKSLVAFPDVLAQMDEHLDWTQKIGDAMIGQQADVADSIQRLRALAAKAGNLQTTPQQTVTTTGAAENVQYVIQPASPEIIYVPSYNPSWAYGPWPYPAYPPTYYPLAGALARGFAWGLGFAAAGAMFGGWNWGGRGNSYVNVNVNRAVNIDNSFNRTNIDAGGRWQHNADHRRGVAYRDPAVRQRYAQQRPGVDQREQFRGRLETGNRPASGPQVANRPNAPRPGNGPPARPGAQRPNALNGVNRGQQVNREAARGQQQINRAGSHAGNNNGNRPNPGGGGNAGASRPAGGGGRQGGGGPAGGGGRR